MRKLLFITAVTIIYLLTWMHAGPASATPATNTRDGPTTVGGSEIEAAADTPPVVHTIPYQWLVVGVPFTYAVQATGDPPPEFSFTYPPRGMRIDRFTGLISWTPAADQTGAFEVTIWVINSVGGDATRFRGTVTSEPVYPPEISPIPGQIATVEQAWSYQVEATGTPTLSYSLTVKPSGMTIDSATGVITWSPRIGQAGSQQVTVKVSSFRGTDTATFYIDVIRPSMTVEISSTEGGSVIRPGEGSFQVLYGATIDLVAKEEPGYYFDSWAGTLAVDEWYSADTHATVRKDGTIVANFVVLGPVQTLTITSGSGGHVQTPGAGTFDYADGSEAALVAKADSGYEFSCWTGTAVDAGKVADPNAATTTVMMDADYAVHANFAPMKGSIQVVAPNGGESFTETGVTSIRWQVQDLGGSVNIELSLDGGQKWTHVAFCTAALGSCDWPIPVAYSDRCLIRISSMGKPAISDTSDGLFGIHTAPSRIWYVDAAAKGSKNSTSWPNAFVRLQDALYKAQAKEAIYVAQGTYWPDLGGWVQHGDRMATFQLKNGVGVYGGFPAGGGPWEQRNPRLCTTTLSGDIGTAGFVSDNSRHVVTGSGTDRSALLDGFVISDGYADGTAPHDCGAGLYSNRGAPTISNCIFIANSAQNAGGAMRNTQGGPLVLNCTFVGNIAVSGNGGGASNLASTAAFVNCAFSGNTAGGSGGGLSCEQQNVSLVNCTFSANAARTAGGVFGSLCAVSLTNCVLWANTDQQGDLSGESAQISANPLPTVNSCCVQGWTGILDGAGNLGDDPLFVDGDGGDGMVGTLDDNLGLRWSSPCVDAGDNTAIPPGVMTDLYGEARLFNERVDLGACEFAPLAKPVAHWKLNEGDGTVVNDSAGSITGTVHGAAWVDGRVGGALGFDGVDDYVDCGTDDALAPERMTVAFWIWAEEPLWNRSILGKATSMSFDRDYTFTTDNGMKLEFSFGESAWKRVAVQTKGALPVGQWVHVAATRDGATASLYLNGQLESSAAYLFPVTSKGQGLRIGSIGTTDGWAGFFKGRIDEVRIYDRALAAEDIQELYQQESP